MARKSVLGKGIGALLNNSMAAPKNFDLGDDQDKAQKSAKPLLKEEKKESKKKSSKEEKVIVEKKEVNENPLMVSIDSLIANEEQPRRFFKEDKLEELSDSIKENGIIQPILVTFIEKSKKFEIIAGERRYRAAKMAGLTQVPVINKKVTEKEKLTFAIIENVQRADLNCVEEALAYHKLMNDFELTQQEVAKRVGKNRSTIANFLRLLKLPQETIMSLQKEEMSFGHAKILGGLEESDAVKFTKLCVDNKWSIKDLTEAIKNPEKESSSETGSKDKKVNPKEGEFSILSEKLERMTGYQFKIKANAKNRGKVEIKFSDINEFNRIYKYLLKSN